MRMDSIYDDTRVRRLGLARRHRIEAARRNPKAWARVWTPYDAEALGEDRVGELHAVGDWRESDVLAIGELRMRRLLAAAMWTTQDVADWHGVQDRTVYQWFNRGKVRPSKFGPANCYPREVATGITPKPKGRRSRQEAVTA